MPVPLSRPSNIQLINLNNLAHISKLSSEVTSNEVIVLPPYSHASGQEETWAP